MELTNEFTVPVGIDTAWTVLTDLERIAPCMPGAQLTEVDGDEYRGTVKVKVGPITAQYKGTATIREADADARRLVVDAGGRDTRGQGSADAAITVTMHERDASTTAVDVHTDLTIKGKVAQFGRGMLADVSAKLLDQFVDCLEDKLDEPEPAASPEMTAPSDATVPTAADGSAHDSAGSSGSPEATPAASTSSSTASSESSTGPRKIDQPAAAPVDLLGAAGSPVLKRAAPAAALVFVLLVLGRLRARRRR